MKYAFMTFSTPALALEQLLVVAQEYGYDGVEIRIDSGHAHGVEIETTASQRTQIKRAFESAHIEVAAIATSVAFADPALASEMRTSAINAIELAGDLGSPVVRVFGGTIPNGMGRAPAITHVAKMLREVADAARDRGVTLCFETHDDWTDPAHVAAVMEAVDHPAVAVNWDVLHPVRTGKATIQQSFDILAPWIRHLHIHDNKGTGLAPVPIGQGDIDHKLVLQLLKRMGYAGYLSGEWIGWEPYDIHLPREIKTMREYEAELS